MYNPKVKHNFWSVHWSKRVSWCSCPVIVIGVIVVILYFSINRDTNALHLQTELRAPGSNRIILDFDQVRAATCAKFSRFINFTSLEYQEYFKEAPGVGRYCLLTHVAHIFHGEPGEFIDVGTRFAASALSLMTHGHSVTTIDTPTSMDLEHMARNEFHSSVNEWRLKLDQKGGAKLLTVVKADLLPARANVSHIWSSVRKAPVIFLDTFHKPDSKPFEREFLKQLVDFHYDGVVILDDIYLNHEMQNLFDELVCANSPPYKAYDLSAVGHSSGTGLLDFERNRMQQRGPRGAYTLVVGSSSEKLAEMAKKSSFLKGGGQLQRFRETEDSGIAFQFLPLECESI